jgi:hypothetical protein
MLKLTGGGAGHTPTPLARANFASRWWCAHTKNLNCDPRPKDATAVWFTALPGLGQHTQCALLSYFRW